MKIVFAAGLLLGFASMVTGDRLQPSASTADVVVISSVDYVGPEGNVCFGVQVGGSVFTASHCLEKGRFLARGGNGLCGQAAGVWKLSEIVEVGRVRGDLGWVGSMPPVAEPPTSPPGPGTDAVVVTFDLTGRVEECGRVVVDLSWAECPTPTSGLGCMVEYGDQVCQGSSGSPVYNRESRLVGVVSRGQPCHRNGERIIWVELIGVAS